MDEVLRAILAQTMSQIDKLADSDIAQIEQCPQGRMIPTINNSRPVIMRVEGSGNARRRSIITKDADLQCGLARRMMLEAELKGLAAENQIISRAIIELDDLPWKNRATFLRQKCPWLPAESVSSLCYCAPDAADWEAELFEQSDFMPEAKTKITSRGLAVRSKSELLIAEALYRHGIPFRYEQILRLDDKHFLVPDFTIKKPNGEIAYWEHLGRMGSEAYARRQLKKAMLYFEAGIVPWKNLIMTFDTVDGDIDLRIIESEIACKLL